jgi:hypothetical protein
MSNVIQRNRRDGHETMLTWLQAVLLACHESRRGMAEVCEALHAGELRTFSSFFYLGSATMTDSVACNVGDFSDLQATAELLIEAGHAERVKEAAKFAASKLEILDLGGDVDWTPAVEDDAHNLLFELVDENYDEIALVGFAMYVEKRLAA